MGSRTKTLNKRRKGADRITAIDSNAVVTARIRHKCPGCGNGGHSRTSPLIRLPKGVSARVGSRP